MKKAVLISFIIVLSSCSGLIAPGEYEYKYDRFELLVEVNQEQVIFRTTIDEPCGCETAPYALEQCRNASDFCHDNCLKCIDYIDIDGEVFFPTDYSYSDLHGIHSHGKQPGDEISLELRGCKQDQIIKFQVPMETAVSATIPHFDGQDLNFTWEPKDADVVEIIANHGLGGTSCWTQDDGNYMLPWFQTGMLMTSIIQLRLQNELERDKLHVQVYDMSFKSFTQH